MHRVFSSRLQIALRTRNRKLALQHPYSDTPNDYSPMCQKLVVMHARPHSTCREIARRSNLGRILERKKQLKSFRELQRWSAQHPEVSRYPFFHRWLYDGKIGDVSACNFCCEISLGSFHVLESCPRPKITPCVDFSIGILPSIAHWRHDWKLGVSELASCDARFQWLHRVFNLC